ncbi:MAG: hypothetical protein Q9227_008633 [Pyrenula ochraceoflavens]
MALQDSTTLSYSPLDSLSIRVLTLEQGTADDPLCGSLKHVSLEHPPEYEALSYVWGDPRPNQVLNTPKGSKAITQSLAGSLKRLRLPESTRVLWIDALCINQDDDEEKSHQVLLMRQIYQSAIRVLVYLGEEYENSQLVPELIQLIHAADLISESSSTNKELSDANDLRWKGLRALLRRPWFRRVWVFQEFIVAEFLVFFCGEWTATWDHLFGAIEKASNNGIRHLWTSFNETFEQNEATGNGLQLFWWLAQLRGNFWRGQKHPLLRLLNLFRWSQASRAHDHLYALLGIAEDGDASALRPNYAQPFKVVVRAFARYFISTENAMEMLYSAGLLKNQSSHPSWIPDWTQNEDGMEELGFKLQTDRGKIYHAARDSAMKMHLAVNDPDTLVVTGAIIDKVVKINEDPSIADNATSMHRLLHWLSDLELNAATLERYPTNEDLDDVQARVLLSNRDNRGSELPPESLAPAYIAYRKLVRASFPHHPDSTPISREEKADLRIIGQPVSEAVGARINGRRPCLTGKDYLGFAPDATRPGDLLAIFLGSTVPFVIRPHDREVDSFWLIGECYVHGIMKGEAFDLPGFCPLDIRLR